MQTYSIKQAENLSGIKAHTLRIWEKRYSLITPLRTHTNIRKYDNNQILKLINISSLLKYGMKISKIASLDNKEIILKLNDFQANQHSTNPTYSIHINNLLISAIQYDEQQFNNELYSCLIKYGMQKTYVEVISPLLIKVGLMWRTARINPSQEHFISNLIKQKLFNAIDSCLAPPPNASKWLLFLRDGEYHEIGLLFASYLLKSSGCKVYYLGQSVPMENITQSIQDIHPNRILTFMCETNNTSKNSKFFNQLSTECKDYKILVCGSPSTLEKLDVKPNIDKIHSIQSLLQNHINHAPNNV